MESNLLGEIRFFLSCSNLMIHKFIKNKYDCFPALGQDKPIDSPSKVKVKVTETDAGRTTIYSF